jgi:hypothetical protein
MQLNINDIKILRLKISQLWRFACIEKSNFVNNEKIIATNNFFFLNVHVIMIYASIQQKNNNNDNDDLCKKNVGLT